jgi:hypothetical protein
MVIWIAVDKVPFRRSGFHFSLYLEHVPPRWEESKEGDKPGKRRREVKIDKKWIRLKGDQNQEPKKPISTKISLA